MKISECKLHRISFQTKFNTLYELKEDVPIILNSLHIYSINDDWVSSEVDFDIFTHKDGKRYISPRYNSVNCDGFLLIGERLAMCKTVEIKAEDYIDVTRFNGNFIFVFEDNK